MQHQSFGEVAHEQHPTLPAELERLIFELTAFVCQESMPALVRVAQRVKIWFEQIFPASGLLNVCGSRIEPLLYGVLTLNSARVAALTRLSNMKPPTFFRDHVRHIYFLSVPNDSIVKILSLCNGVVNVAISPVADRNIPSILETLPLKRIAISPWPYRPRLISTDYHHPLFTRITHLDILNWPDRGWGAWTGLALLPCLTHLSFGTSPSYIPVTIYRGVLTHCRSLEVLALIYESESLRQRAARDPSSEFESDPRFVGVVIETEFVDEWKIGAGGGKDHWAVAERLVKLRRLSQTAPCKFPIP
ncbi:hypothetical protein B0H19DRAFT_1258480 [Mycena capillaripes]|nr:hypothetical protein B0H19DRAFT_1258480 [Mycena capillaripes]